MDDTHTVLLSAVSDNNERRDLALEIRSSASAADLANEIGRHLGVARESSWKVVRDEVEQVLDGDQPVASLRLAHGDQLVMGGASRDSSATTSADIVLSVDGGPASGSDFDLRPGEYLVGRDADCSIVVDDPSLSRRHFYVRVRHDGVGIADSGSTNGTLVGGRRLAAGEEARLSEGTIVVAGRSELSVRPRSPSGRPMPDAAGRMPFNRPPRFVSPYAAASIPLEAPPEEPGRVRLPLLASLLPIVLGVALWLLTRSVLMLAFTALSPLMAVGSYVEDRRGGKGHFKKRSAAFRVQLADVEQRFVEEGSREVASARASSPSASLLVRRARGLLPELWERRETDSDFLVLRVGIGKRTAEATVGLGEGGAEELRREAEAALGRRASLNAVPVTVPLCELGGLGVVGGVDQVNGLGRWLTIQASVLHSPRDLVIVAALSSSARQDWDWLKWLPHSRTTSVDLTRTLAVGSEQVSELLKELGEVVRLRRRAKRGATGFSGVSGWPWVLVLIDEDAIGDRAPLAQLLADASDAGIAFIWLGRNARSVPNGCRMLIELQPEIARLELSDARTGAKLEDIVAEGMPLEVADRCARDLAPVVDVSGDRGSARLPMEVGLLGLLGAEAMDSGWITSRWEQGDDRSRRAALGATAEGVYSLDLRADGPHALIAGTTGSGKSELLQSLVASLALTYPPNRLTFLLIDYKGGAAFKDCMHLPHTVGIVTDLDGHLAQRALVSLNAELRAREALLREKGTKDLLELAARYPDSAPPDLVIVIDEFATLANEVPDFVAGIVDVAQRGRSLGVHLILATQRPGGIVSDNIRANTNLRIALRVNEPGESADVLGSEVAARIRNDQSGRAFARTGQGELIEFQTAYVGGLSRLGAHRPTVTVSDFNLGGNVVPGDRTVVTSSATDLSRIVETSREAWAELRRPDPTRPWLAPLASTVSLSDMPRGDAVADGQNVVLGLSDEPEHQRQTPLVVDLEAEGSVVIFGSSGSGKTTLLRTIAAGLAAGDAPRGLHLYGIDFATRGLLALETFPQCGRVITAEDPDLVERLFTVLQRELTRRKTLFSQVGVTTLSSYNASQSHEPIARTVVLVDGYAGFHAAFEKVNLGELVDALPRLVSEGRPLGIHFVITADRRAAVPGSLLGLIGRRLVLRMADADEFSALGVNPRLVKDAFLPAGRGFTNNVEFQAAVVGDDASGEAQTREIQRLGVELRAKHPGEAAPAIQALPDRVPRASLPSPSHPLEAIIGLSDDQLGPVRIELQEGHFSVIGPYRSGKSTALGSIAESLARSQPTRPMVLLAPRRSPLVDLSLWTSVASGVEECAAAARLLADPAAETTGHMTVVFVDDAEELAEGPAAASLEILARRGRDIGVVLITASERQSAQRAYGWLRDVRKDEHGLLLDPDVDIDGDMLGVRLPRRTNAVFPAGRGYLAKRGVSELVQVAEGDSAGLSRE